MTVKRLEYDHVYNTDATLICLVLALLLGAGGFFLSQRQVAPIVRALESTVVTIPDDRTGAARRAKATMKTTWAKELGGSGPLLYVQCRFTPLCNAGLNVKPVPYLGLTLMFLGLLSGGSGILISTLLRRKRDTLDNAKWLSVDQYKHPEVLRFTEGERNKNGEITDPVIVTLGYVVEQAPMPNNYNPNRPLSYRYNGLKKIGLTSRMLQEHVLVYGPTGTGKTSRVLMHFLLAFAKRGDAVVLPDFKYPKVSEGFLEALALFRRIGAPVYPVLPYTPGGVNIPIFDTLQTPQQGRDLAAIIIPELEFGVSDSAFWKQTQQIILGSVFRTVAGTATPTFAEVIRVMRMPLAEFGQWLTQSGDAEAISQLARFMRLKDADWNSFTTGILNGLEPFDDDRVNRTFTSVEGKNFSPLDFVMRGGLLYYGVPTDKMRTKRGETIVRVFDTYITNEFVRLRTLVHETGPQRSIRMMYDEAPNFGRLQNILKSVSTLRAFDISFIFGIQNEDQMSLNYTDDVWQAITANLATHIILPTGFKDQAASTLSRYLGEREIKVVVNNQSSGTGSITQAAVNSKKGRSVVTQKRPLVTPSEIEEWPYFLGILRTKGTLPPALLAVVPTHDPKPVYYGLDNRKFTLNNSDVYQEFTDIMDVMNEADRTREVLGYINETVTEDDLNEHLPVTLKDLFNEWVRYAILDGALFRLTGKHYHFRYDSVDVSLRDGNAERVVLAFVRSGWFDPGESIAYSPMDWEWIKVTNSGFENLSGFVQAELKNVLYLTEYIHARKELHLSASNLSGGILEARQLLPVDAAEKATLQLLTRTDSNADKELLTRATAMLMGRFTRATVEGIEMVAIPLNFPFDYVLTKVLREAAAGGTLSEEDVRVRDRAPLNLEKTVEALDRAQEAPEETPAAVPPAEPVAGKPEAPAAPAAPEVAPAPTPPTAPVPVPEVGAAAPVAVTADILPEPDAEEDLPFPTDLPPLVEQSISPEQQKLTSGEVEKPTAENEQIQGKTEPGQGSAVSSRPPPRRQRGTDLLTRTLQGEQPSAPEPAAPAEPTDQGDAPHPQPDAQPTDTSDQTNFANDGW